MIRKHCESSSSRHPCCTRGPVKAVNTESILGYNASVSNSCFAVAIDLRNRNATAVVFRNVRYRGKHSDGTHPALLPASVARVLEKPRVAPASVLSGMGKRANHPVVSSPFGAI